MKTAPRNLTPGTIRNSDTPGVIHCWDPATNECVSCVGICGVERRDAVLSSKTKQIKSMLRVSSLLLLLTTGTWGLCMQ